jgi:hypothetical protein
MFGCAAIDVGQEAVAARRPGAGPNGPVTVTRTYKRLYGVLTETASSLSRKGVTYAAMESPGIYSMPVRPALTEHRDFEKVLFWKFPIGVGRGPHCASLRGQ